MGLTPFLIRRGRRYSWRREVRGITIQIPLNTDQPAEARAIAAAATAASIHAFEAIGEGRLDPKAARAMIEQAARYEAARQTMRKGATHMFFFWHPLKAPREMREEGLSEKTIRMTIRRGRKPIAGDFEGWDEADIAEYLSILNRKKVSASVAVVAEAPAKPEGSSAAIAAATSSPTIIVQNHYHGAPVHEPPRQQQPPAAARDDADPAGWEQDTDEEALPPPPAAKSARTRRPEPPAADGQKKTSIMSLVPRINSEEMKRGKVNAGSARDFERTLQLFMELSGIEFVEDIEQQHLADFVDNHDVIPTHYRKSQAERNKPIWDIIEDAADDDERELGLSAATTNKNITNLAKLFRKARSYGIAVHGTIDPGSLRISEKEAKKNKRKPFSVDDIKAIFEQPALSLNADRDALFWIAHAAAYTGARREEIAGLDAADIETRSGVPFFIIRPNAHRTLKNGQSERLIPLHRDLISLGLNEYAKERAGRGMLFEIRKKSKASSYGDSISYRWRQTMIDAIGTGHRKTFHSFRHSAIDCLMKAQVDINTRGALFGHLTGHIEGDLYGGDAELGDLLDAVNLIPSVR